MKLILTSILTLVAAVSFANTEAGDLKFKCDWVKSDSHSDNYFVKDASFTLHFLKNTKVKITDDTFFNRTYKPCWAGGYSSCMFSFSYDADDVWEYGLGNENEEGGAGVLTQVWTTGTVGGVSEIKLYDANANGDITIVGDDGDGTQFTENFTCDIISPSGDVDFWDIFALIFSGDED